MRETKKKAKKKTKIGDNLIQLFKIKLREGKFLTLNLDTYLETHLTGYYTLSKIHILEEGEYFDDMVLITSGAVTVYYLDPAKAEIVHMLFTAGQFVSTPLLFNTGKKSRHFFSTSTQAEYLVLPKEQYEFLRRQNTGAVDLKDIVIRDYWDNFYLRDSIHRAGKQKVFEFFECFRDMKGNKPKVDIELKLIASYLTMDPRSLSRRIKEIRDENNDWEW